MPMPTPAPTVCRRAAAACRACCCCNADGCTIRCCRGCRGCCCCRTGCCGAGGDCHANAYRVKEPKRKPTRGQNNRLATDGAGGGVGAGVHRGRGLALHKTRHSTRPPLAPKTVRDGRPAVDQGLRDVVPLRRLEQAGPDEADGHLDALKGLVAGGAGPKEELSHPCARQQPPHRHPHTTIASRRPKSVSQGGLIPGDRMDSSDMSQAEPNSRCRKISVKYAKISQNLRQNSLSFGQNFVPSARRRWCRARTGRAETRAGTARPG